MTFKTTLGIDQRGWRLYLIGLTAWEHWGQIGGYLQSFSNNRDFYIDIDAVVVV
jgi:hypothetical protein